MLDGQEHSVTANLLNALKALRSTNQTRVLWIDAVCINQRDTSERSAQVTIMGSIYRNAKRTLVWLDEVDVDIVEHIRTFSEDPERHFQDIPVAAAYQLAKGEWWKRHLQRYKDALRQHYLSFSHCCEDIAKERGQYPALPMMRGMMSHACSVIQDLLTRREAVRKGETFDLLKVAFEQSPREATDLRDKLYGYFGLCVGSPAGCVDYHLGLKDCYIEFAKRYIEQTSNVRVLSYVVQPIAEELTDDSVTLNGRGVPDSHRLEGLPTWCPDWSQVRKTQGLIERSAWHESIARFSPFPTDFKRQTPEIFLGMTDTVVGEYLAVSGVICDTITELGDYEARAMVFPADMYRSWLSLLDGSRCHYRSVCDGCGELTWCLRTRCMQGENLSLCISCFGREAPRHPEGHDFEIDMWREVKEKRENSCIDLSSSPWETLADIRYQFVEGDESVQDALRKTMMLDQSVASTFKMSAPEPGMESLLNIAAFTGFWLTCVERKEEVEMSVPHDYTSEEVGGMLSAIESEHGQWVQHLVCASTYRRRLVIAAKGYIGLAPPNAEEGDLVCTLYGSHMPHILRAFAMADSKDPIDQLHRTLVGDAYVHGLMNGEAGKRATNIPELAKRFVIH